MGDDLVDTGHFLGFRGIDALDKAMGDLGLDQGQAGRIGRHLQGQVRAVIPGAGHLGQGRRPGILGADDLIVGGLEEEVFLFHLAAKDLGGVYDSIYQGLIAGAAADVAVDLEPPADLISCRVGILFQEDLGRHDKAG